MGKTSNAVKDRYNAKVYDEIKVRVSKGTKQAIQDVATAKGEKFNGYIKNAIKAQIQGDTGEDIDL